MDLLTYYKQHPEERYEHIRRMGEILSRVEQTLAKAETVLEEWKALQDDFKTLVAYYDSPQWQKDYFDSKYPNGYLLKMLSSMLLVLSLT